MHIQKGEEEPTKEVYVSLHQKHSELAEENLSTAIEFLSRLTIKFWVLLFFCIFFLNFYGNEHVATKCAMLPEPVMNVRE